MEACCNRWGPDIRRAFGNRIELAILLGSLLGERPLTGRTMRSRSVTPWATRSSRARHGGPAGRAQLTQRSILKLPSLLIASIFPALCLCASAWFDQLEVDSPKVTPINSPVLYDSQTLSECQGPSGWDKPPSSPPNSTTKSIHHRLRSYKARSPALRKCPCGATNYLGLGEPSQAGVEK